MPTQQFKLATCQFPVSADLHQNAAAIRRQMRQARKQGADVAHFPEACLSGYGGVEIHSWKKYDWELLRTLTQEIMDLAGELKLWVIVGSAHQLSSGHKPHNCLYIINDKGRLVTRYDKRMCTQVDLKYYSPGDHSSIFTIKGIKCAAIICFEVRFPELYRDYERQDVRVMFHSFYNARVDADTIHTVIMRPSLQAHAASNGMFISAANAATPHQCWPGVFIEPDGVIRQSLQKNKSGVMVNAVNAKKQYYDISAPFRRACVAGRHFTGTAVKDARSADLTSL